MASFFFDNPTQVSLQRSDAVEIDGIPVEITNLTNNQVIGYDTDKWVNMPAGSGTDASSILSKPVTFTSPADGDVIAFDGSTDLINKTLFPLPNSDLAAMAGGTWKGNPSGSSHTPYDVSVGTLSESNSNVLSISGGTGALLNNATIEMQQASLTSPGYISAADYAKFDANSDGITALTGDVEALGPGSAVASISDAAVVNKLLIDFEPSPGTISATDSVLSAFEKVGSALATAPSQIIIGNSLGVATPTNLTGDASLSDSGEIVLKDEAVTAIVLADLVNLAGNISASDTVLTGFGKTAGSLNTAPAQIVLGDALGVATPTTVSGDLTFDSSGVALVGDVSITGKLLTGYSKTAGSLVSSDSILEGFNKVGNSLDTSAGQIIVGNSAGVASPVTMSGAVTIDDTGVTSFSPSGITSTLLTGYTPATGKVDATDTILQGFDKVGKSLDMASGDIVVGNASGVATPLPMTGDVTINDLGVTSLATPVTSTVLAGYSPTSGSLASTDTILEGFNKVGNSLNTTAAQIVLGNASNVATPVAMTGHVSIDSLGETTILPSAITSTVLTDFSPSPGKITSLDSILEGFNKVGNSLNTNAGEVVVGNSSGVASPVAISGAITIDSAGVTSLTNPATSTVLTGYSKTAGKIADTDTILEGFDKVGNSLDTAAGQIIVGNSSGVASAVTMSGDVTINDTGVTTLATPVISNVLTGYTPTEGKVAATDTIVEGFNKVGNSLNTTAGQLIVGNASGVASPVTMSGAVTMDSSGVTTLGTGITSTPLTGFSKTEGTVAETDTILEGFNKLSKSLDTSSGQIVVGNASGVASAVAMSGDVTIDNAGVTSLATPVTSTLLTGYVATKGKLAATDAVLQGFEKVGKSLDTTAGQIIVGNSSGVATPVAMSGALTIDSDGVTTLESTGITSALLTGYVAKEGKLAATDTVLDGFEKVGKSLDTTAGQLIVGNASGIATPQSVAGDVTISDTGVTTIGLNAVTNAKSARMAANTMKGNNTGSTANALDLTVTEVRNLVSSTTPEANVIPQMDANKNLPVNNVILGATSTATAAGTTTLTVASTALQVFTGTSTQTVLLPSTSTLTAGHSFTIINNSTGLVTVNTATSTYICVVNPSSFLKFVLINSFDGVWRYFSSFPLTVSAYLPITSNLSSELRLGNIKTRLNTPTGIQVAATSTAFTADVNGIGISTTSRTIATLAGNGLSVPLTYTSIGTDNGNTFNSQRMFVNDRTNTRIYEIKFALFGSGGSATAPRDGFVTLTQWN